MTITHSLLNDILDSDFPEHNLQRTKSGEATLEKIEPDKGGEPKPVGTLKKRTPLHTQAKRDQDEQARKDADHAIDGHVTEVLD
jgi:hypothetical protein